MERIPEFNFPHFKPEIHNDKAGDQRVGKQQGALWDFKTKPCLLQLLLRRRGFTHESESTRFTQGAAAADKVHNAFCFAVAPPIGHWH